MMDGGTDHGRSAAGAGGGGPRVLMALWDGGGNVGPQRALARELRRRGSEVHAVAHDSVAERLRADGVTFHRLRSARQFDFAEPHTLDEQVSILQGEILGSADFAADVMEAYGAVAPDVFMIDCMLVSTMAAAVDHGARFSVFHHVAWMPGTPHDDWMNRIHGLLPRRAEAGGFGGLLAEASLVLATSYRDFATGTEVPSNVAFVGPIREAAETAAWPRRYPDRPSVLVGMSSVYQQQDQILGNTAAALSRLPVEALITTGRGIDPADLDPADNLQVRAFVEHDAILPLSDLVVTHGGLGTTSFSAGAGVPVLCLPNGRDQDDNAARVEALGLGRTLTKDATPDRIAATVAEMLADRRMHEACRAFAARVSRFGDLARAADLVRAQAASG